MLLGCTLPTVSFFSPNNATAPQTENLFAEASYKRKQKTVFVINFFYNFYDTIQSFVVLWKVNFYLSISIFTALYKKKQKAEFMIYVNFFHDMIKTFVVLWR